MACEWNPAAADALRHNLDLNRCASRCEILQGDCRQMAPQASVSAAPHFCVHACIFHVLDMGRIMRRENNT